MTDRDQQIIRHTDRYRIGTNAAYHSLVFDGQSLNAVTKVTARMCREGWLQRYRLVPPEDYFTLGPKAVRHLGYSLKRTEPLGPQALPIDYAVLLFATHGGRTRLLPFVVTLPLSRDDSARRSAVHDLEHLYIRTHDNRMHTAPTRYTVTEAGYQGTSHRRPARKACTMMRSCGGALADCACSEVYPSRQLPRLGWAWGGPRGRFAPLTTHTHSS